ncbi:MAG: zinc ribbon domain-containing protein [Candidatus Hodarchaeales archaeon]
MDDDFDFLKENPFIIMGIGLVFLSVFTVGLLITLITDGSFWTTGWAIIPGGILLAVGIAYYYQKTRYENMVLGILKNYENSTISLLELQEQLGDIDLKLLRKLLFELQGTGKLTCRIDRGQLTVMSVQVADSGAAVQPLLTAGPSAPELASEGDFVYCPFCGAKNKEKAIFCKNCGQAFQ